MAKTYLLKFTPHEPFFFGNERTFAFPEKKGDGNKQGPYFIRSERFPSQSTIFGAIRYLMIPEKRSDYKYNSEALGQIIGEESFDVERNGQTFGMIEKISPVFLHKITDEDGEEEFLIRTPFNHIVKKTNSDGHRVNCTEYSPLPHDSYESVKASGQRELLYSKAYCAKDGLTDSFVGLISKRIFPTDELFPTTVRVGIDTVRRDDAYFKKEYSTLRAGYSFAVYLTLKDEAKTPKNQIVYLGQSKSPFTVTVEEQVEAQKEDPMEKIQNGIKELLKPGVPQGKTLVYCLSDAFVDSSIYGDAAFSIVKTKTYRAFTTTMKRSVKKGETLFLLPTAGSVFITSAPQFADRFQHSNANTVGYNFTVAVSSTEV